jgi:hypothetical protein
MGQEVTAGRTKNNDVTDFLKMPSQNAAGEEGILKSFVRPSLRKGL